MPKAISPATEVAPSPDDKDEVSRQVLRRFRQIFNAVKTHFRQVESQAGLGGAQVRALGLVSEHPDIGVSELSHRMDVHQSTASNLVRGLLDRKLIAGAKNDADRRAVQLRILPAGRQILRAAPGQFDGILPDALTSLDVEMLERMRVDLDVLISALKLEDADSQKPLAEH